MVRDEDEKKIFFPLVLSHSISCLKGISINYERRKIMVTAELAAFK